MNQYDVSAMSSASPSTVYELLLDGSSWPRWSPIDSYEPGTPSGRFVQAGPVGQVRVFRTGRNVSREEIVEVVQDRRLVYAMLSDGSGLLRGYRGQIAWSLNPATGRESGGAPPGDHRSPSWAG